MKRLREYPAKDRRLVLFIGAAAVKLALQVFVERDLLWAFFVTAYIIRYSRGHSEELTHCHLFAVNAAFKVVVERIVKAQLIFLRQLHNRRRGKKLCHGARVAAAVNRVINMSALIREALCLDILKIISDFHVSRARKARSFNNAVKLSLDLVYILFYAQAVV